MIQRLKESVGAAVGFKVSGKVTSLDVQSILPEIETLIAHYRKRRIGILMDLSDLKGVEWKARWEEIRFLRKYADHIARVAVVGAHPWEELKASEVVPVLKEDNHG